MRKILILILIMVMGIVTFNQEKPKYHSMQHSTKGDVSFYGRWHHGKVTAVGEPFNMYAMTAAHKTLPFGTRVRITNKANGKSVVVRINDRGPYVKGRDFDLSMGAFQKIASTKQGIIKAENLLIEILSIGTEKYRRRK